MTSDFKSVTPITYLKPCYSIACNDATYNHGFWTWRWGVTCAGARAPSPSGPPLPSSNNEEEEFIHRKQSCWLALADRAQLK